MNRRNIVFLALLLVESLLGVGDYFAKRAVATADRHTLFTGAALLCWIAACFMWLPIMRARGFTRLVAMADVIGLIVLAIVGYCFLGERLTLRESAGVGLAVAALFLLGGSE